MIEPEDLIQGSKIQLINYAKKEYNKRIERIKKAELFYSSPNITEEQIEKSYSTLVLILNELQSIGDEIEKLTGEEITTDIAVNGFKGV